MLSLMSRNACRVLFYMCVGKMSTTKTVIESAREGLHTRQASHPNRRIAFSMEPYRSFVDSGGIWSGHNMGKTRTDSPRSSDACFFFFFFFLLTSHFCHPPMGDHDFCYTSLPLSRWKCIYFDAGFHPVESQRSQCCLALTTTQKKNVCVSSIDRELKCISNHTVSRRTDTDMPRHAIDGPCQVIQPCILASLNRIYFCARYSHLKIPPSTLDTQMQMIRGMWIERSAGQNRMGYILCSRGIVSAPNMKRE